MAAAWVLTLLALAGAIAGVVMGQSRSLSAHLAAAGGGLLFGIALFWMLPDIAATAGWPKAIALSIAACLALALVDRALIHTGHSPRHGVVGPVLVATALHSLLDGWSVRAVAGARVTDVAVPLGLALHKIPEGLGLGWLTARSLGSRWKAAFASGAVELLTVAGAFVEPRANESGIEAFGTWWTAVMLAIIAGGFAFVGFHAVLPNWRNSGVIVVFLATLLLVGMIRQ